MVCEYGTQIATLYISVREIGFAAGLSIFGRHVGRGFWDQAHFAMGAAYEIAAPESIAHRVLHVLTYSILSSEQFLWLHSHPFQR